MTSYSLFSDVVTGPSDVFDDGQPINVGTAVRVSSTMWITHGRFWLAGPSAGAYGTVTAQVWLINPSDPLLGTKLAQKAFTGLIPGWNNVEYDDPIELTVGNNYKLCHHSSANKYTATGGYWNAGGPGAAGISAGAMVAPHRVDTPGGLQSAFFIGSGSIDVMPNDEFGGGNYWTDVIVSDVDPSIPTGPLVRRLEDDEWVEAGFVRRFDGSDWVDAEVQVLT